MRRGRVLAAIVTVALLGAAYAQMNSVQRRSPTSGVQQFHNDVIAYAAFQSDVSDLASMEIRSEQDVDFALDLAARHDARGLVRGWMVYNADVAARSVAFVDGLRAEERRVGKAGLMNSIAADRSYARRTLGGEQALSLVVNAIAADAARVISAAERFRQSAAGLPSEPWAGVETMAQHERVERLRALGRPGGFSPSISISLAARLAPPAGSASADTNGAAFGGRRFWDAVLGAPYRLEASAPAALIWRENPARSETMDAILSVAALRVIATPNARADVVISSYLREPRSISCLELAQLQFHQCVSTVRFVYENGYCLAMHGLRDPGVCLGAPVQPDSGNNAVLVARQTRPNAGAASAAAQTVQASPPTPANARQASAAPAQATPAPAPAPVAAPPASVRQANAASTQTTPVASPPPVAATPANTRQGSAAPAQASTAAAPALVAAQRTDDAFLGSLRTLGAGELFARADELDEQGAKGQARIVRRALIARFPDSPLALVAAQQLARAAAQD